MVTRVEGQRRGQHVSRGQTAVSAMSNKGQELTVALARVRVPNSYFVRFDRLQDT